MRCVVIFKTIFNHDIGGNTLGSFFDLHIYNNNPIYFET